MIGKPKKDEQGPAPRRNSKIEAIVAQAGLPPGMSCSRPVDKVKYYVIAPTQKEFALWVKERGKNLQSCNYIGVIEGMFGIGFESPEIELVIVNRGNEGKGEEFFQESCRLISRYCIDKRLHDCKRDRV